MGISHVNTQTATQGDATSVTATKPTGTASGDVLLALFTSNNQNASPPSGWSEVFDDVTEVFRCQMFYKVAGGSEPANYAFTVGSNAPLVLVVSAWRGVDTADPFDIDPVTNAQLTASEPFSTPTVSGGTTGRLMYARTVRLSGSTPPTFTASGVTEHADVGIFSGGSVCYSTGFYGANSDFSSSGSKSGLAITCNSGESHNITATWALKSSGVPGTLGATMPLPTMTAAAEISYAGTMGVTVPVLPAVDVSAFYGAYEGPLDVQVPINVSIAAASAPQAALATVVRPVVSITAETRRFAENVVQVEAESRWLIITQDDIRLGSRDTAQVEMVPLISIPLPVVAISGSLPIGAEHVATTVTAYQPRIAVTFAVGTANASCHN